MIGALVGLAVVSGVLLYRDATAAREALLDSQQAVGAVRDAVGEADLVTARDQVDEATVAIGRAASRTSGPLWSMAARLPLVGRSVAVVEAVVDVGQAAVRTVDRVVRGSEGIFDADGNLQLSRGEDGSLDLDQFATVADFLDGLPVGELRDARDRLAAAPASWVPPQLADGRRETLDLAQDAVLTLERARAAMDALPAFLGRDEPRRYFLALQNPGEARGTGGLIGFFAVLTADGGKLDITEPEKYSALVDEERTPVEAPEEFTRRYGHLNADSFFANVNVDPHLPMGAPVMLGIYEARRGEALDGVVMLDPVGTQTILEAIGPVDVPDVAADPSGRIPDPVPAERVAEVTMVDAYDVFGGPDPERKDFHSAFAEAAFSMLLSEWDPVQVGNRIGQAAGRRNLQLYSVRPDEQAAFEQLGVAGRMHAVEDRDLFAVTANNAAGNKMDVHIAHRMRGHVELFVDERYSTGVRRTVDLEVELENPLGTTGHDIYILGNQLINDGELGWNGPLGLNRTWFSIWSGERTQLQRGRNADGEEEVMDSDVIHGHVAVDHYLEVPARSTRSFTVELDGAVPLHPDGPDLVYDLVLWRQAKAIPDHWDLTISPPEGWGVAAVTVEGGGDGRGMGVAGEGTPVRGALEDGVARVRGAATQDVHVSLRFTRPVWDRFVDWLGDPAF